LTIEKPISAAGPWQDAVDATISRYGKTRTSLLYVLEAVQDTMGFIPEKAANYLSKIYRIPVAEIYSVLSFYGMLTVKKNGKYLIKVCDSLSCHLNHSAYLIKIIGEILEIKPGETSWDNEFTLETVDCLGLCDQAPVMVVNDKTFGKLTRKSLVNILNDLKTGSR